MHHRCVFRQDKLTASQDLSREVALVLFRGKNSTKKVIKRLKVQYAYLLFLIILPKHLSTPGCTMYAGTLSEPKLI